MAKKIIIFTVSLLGFALLIVGPLALVKISQIKKMIAAGAAMVMPPTSVTASPAVESSWETVIRGTGSLMAVQGVTISAEIPGKIAKISFEAGTVVQANDVLIQLDVTSEEAQLRAAEATSALAKANLTRARELRQNNTNSPAELDAADAEAKQAEAQAESTRATIAKKTIRAPFTGRLGLRMVNLGQILREGDMITTLQTLDPIYVNFSLPQQRVSDVSVGTVIRVKTDAAPGQTFEGKITAISPEIDATSRNIHLQATLANQAEKLRPGMYASVQVVLPEQRKVLMIPVTAVLPAPYGDSVFILDDKTDEKSGKTEKVLRQQFVRISGAQGDFVNVVDGLKAGDLIVTSGVFKLRPGMPAIVDNKLALNPQLQPKPENK
ncbi:MAG: efflux RND transporter periplasmic adaptor subunit [Opitutaceae bacterium]